MEILGRMNRFQGPRWPTQASEGRSSKLVGGWGEAENEKRQGPGHIGPLCVLWGLESALSGPPCLSPPDTRAVFNTEEFCDLWLLLYVKVQPKTSQTYGFCLCVTCGPSPQAATLPAVFWVPCSRPHAVSTKGANTETSGSVQQHAASPKADVQKCQDQKGFRFNDSRHQV